MSYKSFQESSVFASLSDLAKSPIDLTTAGLLEKRIPAMKSKAVGFDYCYATQQVEDEHLAAFQTMSEELGLIDQFKAMMSGEVMNKIEGVACENRQVLHTAVRDCFSDLTSEVKSDVEAKAAAEVELAKLKTFCADLDSGSIVNAQGEKFTEMVLVGIGGSDLGPRAVFHGLEAYARADRKVHFISNVDPDDAALVMSKVQDLSKTLVCVVSKSGTTLETLTNETLVASYFEKAGLDATKHFVCVTGKGSPMDNPAKYLRSLYMFDYIGGRYSVTSMVGGVILSFALGFEHFESFLRGARKMDLNALETDVKQNLSLLAAMIGLWNRNFLGHQSLAVLPYSQALIRWAAHLQQCDMESNGKSVNRQAQYVDYVTGPIIWGEPGTNGQHAFYQLIHQGKTVIPCDFIGFRQSQHGKDLDVEGTNSQEKLLANLFAQSLGLAQGSANENANKNFAGNRPNSLILADKLTPEVMGSLLAFYENKIAFQGFLWNINSFDQEGVQLGKVLATEIIDAMREKRSAGGASGALMQELLG